MWSFLPLLVFQHRNHFNGDADQMLMFSISQKSLHTSMELETDLVANKNVCWTTPQGWMLVVSSSPYSALATTAWLWNPHTKDKITLPDLEDEHDIPTMGSKCLLTHRDATHPKCLVVLFDYKEPKMWYCKVGVRGGGWSRYTYDIGDYEVPDEPPTKDVVTSVAVVQGEIFFVSSADDMCAINFSSSTHPQPKFQYFDACMVDFPEGVNLGSSWLVEYDDELYLACVMFVGFDADNIGAIQVYKMDFLTEAWCRVRDIGDAVFLLEHGGNMGASCQASPLGLKGNHIYFMKNFKAHDADLCVFDIGLDQQEITRVHHYEHLNLCRKPFWILPPR